MQQTVMVATPVGYVQVIADGGSVTALEFEHMVGGASAKDAAPATSNPTLRTAIQELEAYFSGQQQDFTFDWDLSHQGTPFQQAVWQVISEIPYGQVMSYKEIAETIGKPRAYRAVANACGCNPLPIVVPCHRVVGSGSKGKYTIGGYSSGLDKKRTLMAIEGIEL